MPEPIHDLVAPWTLHGPELVRRMLAVAYEEELAGHPDCARRIRDVIACDRNPLPHLPPLGDPPTVRPAAPDLGIRLRTGPNQAALRRARDPGEL